MRKNIFVITGMTALVLLVAGCGQVAVDQNKTADNGAPKNDKQFKIDLPKGAISDLVVGKKIMAMGSSGADGTLTANRIIIGDAQSFGMFGRNASSTTSKRPVGGNRPRNRMNRASGEIVKIDQNSIILKTDNGGSAIVFFSDKTEIYLPSNTTTPPAKIDVKPNN